MRWPAAVVVLLAASCSTPPASTPPRLTPVARRTTPPDWFQQQLAAARQARSSHLPHDDAAGAQAAYDNLVHTACVRVALSGPEKYQARCAALLQQSPSQATPPFACDDAATDPAALQACND